jgi:hypothetical protein
MMKVPDHVYILYYVLMLCVSVYFLTCDMYMSSLRHIHDPVLSSLKMKGIRLLFILVPLPLPQTAPTHVLT